MGHPILIPIRAADAIRWAGGEIDNDYLFAHQTPAAPQAVLADNLPDRAALYRAIPALIDFQRRGMVCFVGRTQNPRWLAMLVALGCRVTFHEGDGRHVRYVAPPARLKDFLARFARFARCRHCPLL